MSGSKVISAVEAMDLARRRHAPDLTLLLSGCYHNSDLSVLAEMQDSEHDSQMRAQETIPDSGRSSGFGFSSAAQVDRVGNINSVCIGPHDRPTVRLVGPILQPEHMTCFRREYVMMQRYDKRTFVEKVDFVSGVSFPGGGKGREALGPLDHVPQTPEPDGETLRLIRDVIDPRGLLLASTKEAGIAPNSGVTR